MTCPKSQSWHVGSGFQLDSSDPELELILHQRWAQGPASQRDLPARVPRTDGPPLYPRPMEAPPSALGILRAFTQKLDLSRRSQTFSKASRHWGQMVFRVTHLQRAHPPTRCPHSPSNQTSPAPVSAASRDESTLPVPSCKGSAPLAQILSTGPWARTQHRSELEQTTASPWLGSHLTSVHSPQPPRSFRRGEGIQGSP